MAQTKQEYYEDRINNMLESELTNLKRAVKEIEGIINADLLDVETKAIKILEEKQKVYFNSEILRELKEMRKP